MPGISVAPGVDGRVGGGRWGFCRGVSDGPIRHHLRALVVGYRHRLVGIAACHPGPQANCVELTGAPSGHLVDDAHPDQIYELGTGWREKRSTSACSTVAIGWAFLRLAALWAIRQAST
jgi:hypothetical protein